MSKKQKEEKVKKNNLIIPLFLLIIFLGTLGYIMIYFFMPNFKQKNFFIKNTQFKKENMNLIVDDKIIDTFVHPIKKDGEFYFPLRIIREYIDEYIFWDEKLDKMTITTKSKVLRIEPENLFASINSQEFKLNLPIYNIDNEPYIPFNLLKELYNVSMNFDEEYNFIILNNLENSNQVGEIIGENQIPLRYEPNIKSEIIEKINPNEKVTIYNMDDFYLEEKTAKEFIKVRTQKGLIGYILNKNLGAIETVNNLDLKTDEIPEVKNKIEGKINLLWDGIYSLEANFSESRRKREEGVNVLSPTWFKFNPETMNGDLLSIADRTYVDWAHTNGYQVWGLLSDFADENVNFTSSVLNNTDYRQNAINQLMAYVELYNLDGINIDFEHVKEGEDVQYYLQFLRELNPFLKEKGLSLSVDMYVPLYTVHYNRTEVAKVADYICVMSYDEHTGSNPGPVASYDFVKKGIEDTLLEVPKEKVIMGLPLYSRIFKNGKRDSEKGRGTTIEMFNSNGSEFIWDENLKVYYGEYTDKNGDLFQVWLEEGRGLKEKMTVYNEYDLAGVAIWARGLGYDEFFTIVNQELNK